MHVGAFSLGKGKNGKGVVSYENAASLDTRQIDACQTMCARSAGREAIAQTVLSKNPSTRSSTAPPCKAEQDRRKRFNCGGSMLGCVARGPGVGGAPETQLLSQRVKTQM